VSAHLTCESVASAGLGNPVRREGAELVWRCPHPGPHTHGDAHPSLKINPKKDVFMCAPCGAQGKAWVLAAFLAGVDAGNKEAVKSWLERQGLLSGAREIVREIVAVYSYTDEDGELLFQTVRYAPKSFRARRPDPDKPGEWVWNLNGVRRVLYRLPEVLKASSVLVVEGEKDVETARKLGLVATCNSGGAGKWRDEYSEALADKLLTIIPDADEPGRKHGQTVAASLEGKAASTRVIELPGAKDLSEWVAHGGTRESLLGLIEAPAEATAQPGNDDRIPPPALPLVAKSESDPNESTVLTASGAETLDPEPTNLGVESPPAITVTPGESPKAVDEAEEFLLDHCERLGIFQRSGEVVRAVRLSERKDSCGLHREAGTVQLAPVGQIALMEIFDRLIVWQRLRSTEDGDITTRIDCPGRVAAAYLARIGSWRLPLLVGIISAPIMRSDGTILSRAGYDEPTGLYLKENWPDLDGNPTKEDALKALEILRNPFEGFPFVADEDRSVLLVAILTALQRRLLASAPLFGFTAPTPRTGKSLLSESVAIIATGWPAPAMAVSGDREEMRKAVAASLREGHVIVNLDNIERPMGSPDLARAITQPEYQDRLLGETKMLRLPTNVMWTATGNNLAFRGDLAVRTIICRLDARLERPEERTFKIVDLKAYITEHRRELVMAALTILRAYVLAGKPDQRLTPWGGFDEWSRTIRAALVWLGMADPCDTRQHVIEEDPDREQAAAVLSAWHSVVGHGAVKIAHVVGLATNSPELTEALLGVAAAKNDGGRIDPRRLAWWCREWRDRVVGGLLLAKDKDYGKSATWRVNPPDSPGRGISGISGTKKPLVKGPYGEDDQFFRGETNPTDPTNPKLDETIFTNPAKPVPPKAGYTEVVL
jgi:putative DNA primase/helicase